MRSLLLVPLLVACSPKPVEKKPPPPLEKPPPPEPVEVEEPEPPLYDPSRTLVVMLGSGTPQTLPERSGPAVAVVAGGRAYLVDCGPGVVRRAAAARALGIEPLSNKGLDRLFVTHLHSDHTAGYPDLILSPWVLGRDTPLEVFGPPGIRRMTGKILEAYSEDITVRLRGNQPANEPGIQVNAHEVKPGPVYEDEHVKVTAFEVTHGAWKHAYGYRFETADRSVVISGDTVAVDSIVEACNGCDVLVHEVYSKKGFDTREPEWQAYHKVSHTSGIELGEIASRARPKLLVLTHVLLWGATEEDLLSEVRQGFDGEVVLSKDLEVY